MKYKYYLVYGTAKQFDSTDAMTKALEKFSEVLKRYNMELLFWGFPFGTTEDFIYVLKGDVKDFEALSLKPDVSEAQPIASGQRTNMVGVP